KSFQQQLKGWQNGTINDLNGLSKYIIELIPFARYLGSYPSACDWNTEQMSSVHLIPVLASSIDEVLPVEFVPLVEAFDDQKIKEILDEKIDEEAIRTGKATKEAKNDL